MVTFDDTVPLKETTSNFRVTPHPNKKPRTDEDENGGGKPPAVDPTDPSQQLFTNPQPAVSLKEAESTKATLDDSKVPEDEEAADAEAAKKKEEDDEAWQAIVQQINQKPDSASYKSLQVFQQGMTVKEEAKARLIAAFEACQKGLDDAVEKMFNAVAPIHNEQVEGMEALQRNIVQLFQQNHKRRITLVDKLEARDAAWQSTCQHLMGRIMQMPPDSENNLAPPQPMVAAAAAAANKTQQPKKKARTIEDDDDSEDGMGKGSSESGEAEDAEEDLEPNWEELMQYEPSRKNIQLFLAGQARWEAAQERFRNALDEIHDALKAETDRMLFIVEEAFTSVNDQLEEQQNDIEENLAYNFERRQFLEQKIAEHAMQQQSMLAKLMARVVGSQPMQLMMQSPPVQLMMRPFDNPRNGKRKADGQDADA